MADRQTADRLPPAFEEVQIFIDPDGMVTICDLWEGLVPVAEAVGEPARLCPVAPDAPAADQGDPEPDR